MKIAYIGEYHPTAGTYYRQRITVNRAEYDYINKQLTDRYNKNIALCKEKHVTTNEQMNILCFSKPLDISDRKENKIYLKLNQLYFIWSLFPENKRFTDNNTILYIKG